MYIENQTITKGYKDSSNIVVYIDVHKQNFICGELYKVANLFSSLWGQIYALTCKSMDYVEHGNTLTCKDIYWGRKLHDNDEADILLTIVDSFAIGVGDGVLN